MPSRICIERLAWLALVVLLLGPAAGLAQGTGRIYVGRIEFEGGVDIEDRVLRREMLILEGGFLDPAALERSLRRLERLPFVAEAEAELLASPATPDVVDVVVTITPAPPRRYGGGAGYSESAGVTLRGYFTHENLLGTGQRFASRVAVNEFRRALDLEHTDPAARPGVSRTVGLAGRSIDRLSEDTSPLDAELALAELEYGFRTGEFQRIDLGLELRDTELAAPAGTSAQLADWIAANGDARLRDGRPATRFRELDFTLDWRQDTRDRVVRPRRGLDQTLSLTAAVPGSEVEYYRLDYELASYMALGEHWTAAVRAELGYGVAYGGGTTAMPPYLNWLAGGPGTVRGYRDDALGPRDSLGNPYGGNLLTAAQLEVLRPWPGRWSEAVRVGLFYDVGNVFVTEDVGFAGAGTGTGYGFDASELRRSAGLAAEVLIPLGVLRLSYGVPLDLEGADLEDRFQVEISVDF